MEYTKIEILLNTIDKVKTFVNTVTKFDVNMDIHHGRYVIDAKSIMGIFSLDLSKPLTLEILTHENDVIHEVIEAIKDYRV